LYNSKSNIKRNIKMSQPNDEESQGEMLKSYKDIKKEKLME